MVYVAGEILQLLSHAPSTLTHQVRKGAKSFKPAHLNLMPACDEDAEHTFGCAATRRPTLDHKMAYVAGEILQLLPFYAHEIGAKRCEKCQTSPSHLDAGM